MYVRLMVRHSYQLIKLATKLLIIIKNFIGKGGEECGNNKKKYVMVKNTLKQIASQNSKWFVFFLIWSLNNI